MGIVGKTVSCSEEEIEWQNNDIWAYGVTVWEVFTVPYRMPYHPLEPEDVRDTLLWRV